MNWDGYTIFGLLSGAALFACAAVGRDIGLKDRTWLAAGGAFFIIYSVYVGNQTAGTYFFPIWIFVIPFGVVAYFLAKAYARNSK